ncbi:MAG: hypothetical protein L6Q98_05055 [Anaerolineae bacterium]|nr:hypothetical protein [Anaerolineae bacterium]
MQSALTAREPIFCSTDNCAKLWQVFNCRPDKFQDDLLIVVGEKVAEADELTPVDFGV